MSKHPFEGLNASSSNVNEDQDNKEKQLALLEELVIELRNPDHREKALHDLSKKREVFQDLAPLLWNSFGTLTVFLQEIISVYPLLSPPTLTAAASNRICNALALLQCIASHPDTKIEFLRANLPYYLHPFLRSTSKTRPFEYLRLTSLGVIGALVKVDDTEVICYLLGSEIIPLCLCSMENGSELSKTVATFIVQKILLDDNGLQYVCATAERFFALGRALGAMVESLADQPSLRLLKHIIRCYLRLSENPRAYEALKHCLPGILRDATFCSNLRTRLLMPFSFKVTTLHSTLHRCGGVLRTIDAFLEIHVKPSMVPSKPPCQHSVECSVLHSHYSIVLQKVDPAAQQWLQQLIHNLYGGNRLAALQAGGGLDPNARANQSRVI